MREDLDALLAATEDLIASLKDPATRDETIERVQETLREAKAREEHPDAIAALENIVLSTAPEEDEG